MVEKVKKRGIKTFESHRVNPSKITGIVKKSYTRRSDETEMYNKETGEMLFVRTADKKVEHFSDEKPYVKMFKENLLKIGSLSTIALKLFTYIAYTIEKNKDEVIVDVGLFLSSFNYSAGNGSRIIKSHYYKGIVELLENEIVYKKIGSDVTFFINMDVFFNGKREGLFNDRLVMQADLKRNKSKQ